MDVPQRGLSALSLNSTSSARSPAKVSTCVADGKRSTRLISFAQASSGLMTSERPSSFSRKSTSRKWSSWRTRATVFLAPSLRATRQQRMFDSSESVAAMSRFASSAPASLSESMSALAQTVITSSEVEMRETRSGLRSTTVMLWLSSTRYLAKAEPILPAPTMTMFIPKSPASPVHAPPQRCGGREMLAQCIRIRSISFCGRRTSTTSQRRCRAGCTRYRLCGPPA